MDGSGGGGRNISGEAQGDGSGSPDAARPLRDSAGTSAGNCSSGLEALMRALPLVDFVGALPNRAREGHTYITHILNALTGAWALELPPGGGHVLFSQAVPDQAWLYVQGQMSQFRRDSSQFLCLGQVEACTCEGTSFRWHALRRLYEATMHTQCQAPDGTLRTYWACMMGQFVVSASRVRQHSLRTYHQLLALLSVGPQHLVHEEPLAANRTPGEDHWYDQMSKGRQTLDDVYMGHVMERAWSLLFGCPTRQGGWKHTAWTLLTTGRLLPTSLQHC
jgi:hypothetical protein